MCKVIIWSLVVFSLFSLGCSSDIVTGYIGNKKSRIFHRYDCEWGQRISAKNLIKINSRDIAVTKYHMRPCKVCKP